jgi:phosphate binding protein
MRITYSAALYTKKAGHMVESDNYRGRQIGNYLIERTIASGTSGTVYLARHLHLKQRIVAIKVLHAVYLGSDEEKEQFLQEAQILEMLQGLPNILPMLDVGIDGSVPYIIAEYAPQGSLRMRMPSHDGPLPRQEALTIIEQVGRGLQNAHDRGIIHRDLKPENILFKTKDEAVLADFGISTLLSTASLKYTQIAGTPAYMAPEQFRGEISKESDQYSLACIAYELLTGQKLFKAPNFVAMGFLHATEPPTPPRQHNPQITAAVENVLLKALSKQRAERYPSVSAFTAALNNQNPESAVLSEQREKDRLREDIPLARNVDKQEKRGELPRASAARKRRIPIVVSLVILILLLLGGWVATANLAQFSNIHQPPTSHRSSSTPTPTLGTPGTYTCLSGNITAEGSIALQPLVSAVAQKYEARCSGANITVNLGGSSAGLAATENGSVDIANSDLFSKPGQEDLVDHQVSVVVFTLIVNGKVTGVSSLTINQLKAIYTGQTTNWKDLGGPDLPIVIVGRPTTSSTRAAFQNYVLGTVETVAGPANLTTDTTSTALTNVQQQDGAIGYAALGPALQSGLTVLKIDNVEPSPANVESNTYRFWYIEHMYTKGPARPLAQALIDYMASPDGIAAAHALDFIATTEIPVATLQTHQIH